MNKLDEILDWDNHLDTWEDRQKAKLEAKQAIQALILDIIGEDYPKDYPYDDPEAIKYFNIEKERQRAKLKEMK